jgi:hypothetical protein
MLAKRGITTYLRPGRECNPAIHPAPYLIITPKQALSIFDQLIDN